MKIEMPLISSNIPGLDYLAIVDKDYIFEDNFTKKFILSNSTLSLVEVNTNRLNAAILEIPFNTLSKTQEEYGYYLSSQEFYISPGQYEITISMSVDDPIIYSNDDVLSDYIDINLKIDNSRYEIASLEVKDINGYEAAITKTLNVYNGAVSGVFNINAVVEISDMKIAISRISPTPADIINGIEFPDAFGIVEEATSMLDIHLLYFNLEKIFERGFSWSSDHYPFVFFLRPGIDHQISVNYVFEHESFTPEHFKHYYKIIYDETGDVLISGEIIPNIYDIPIVFMLPAEIAGTNNLHTFHMLLDTWTDPLLRHNELQKHSFTISYITAEPFLNNHER